MSFQPPIWDRGDPIDAEMMRFTVGDDWRQDQRLVPHDLAGSRAWARALRAAGVLTAEDHASIDRGLAELADAHTRGEWTVEACDEDVHSAVERRLIDSIGEAGKRLHTGRSRNEQVAVDLALWLRSAVEDTRRALGSLLAAFDERLLTDGDLPLPGYTHLRRAMPSSVALWLGAHRGALALSTAELEHVRPRIDTCPLGTGAGYGVPLELDRQALATSLGFSAPTLPVTLVQATRGRAELAYVTALESLALDLGKLAADLWLYSTHEFGFVSLPLELTTGSSLMPHKRNPDLVELLRAEMRVVASDRSALVDVLRDLPAGYHRDYQLVKPPLFRAHDRLNAALPLVARLVSGLVFEHEALSAAAADPSLGATARIVAAAAEGVPFRDAYRAEASAKR